MEKSIFSAQKYFFFRLPDYLNNSFHFLENKRLESLAFYLSVCISTYEEFIADFSNDKLKKSLKALLTGLKFNIDNHPLKKVDMLRKDFIVLTEKASHNETNEDLFSLYKCMKSLVKKLKANSLIPYYVELLKTNDTFKVTDNIICYLISDLLYKGYSVLHLREWYKENIYGGSQERSAEFFAAIDKKALDPFIDKILTLNVDVCKNTIVKKLNIRPLEKAEEFKTNLSKKFCIFDIDEDTKRKNRWFDDDCIFIIKEIEACDKYRALDQLSDAVDNYINIYKEKDKNINIKQDSFSALRNEDVYELIDTRKINTRKLIDYIDQRQKVHLDAFVDLEISSMYNEDLEIVGRVLQTLIISKSLSDQNRFLNFWSALEYIVYPQNKISIIEKVRSVLPKSFALFMLKDKINIFWERFINYYDKKKITSGLVYEFYHVCIKEDSNEYITPNIVTFIADTTRLSLVIDAIDHIVLQRELMELNLLLTNKGALEKELKFLIESIECDINLIYRIRNQLIHSAKNLDDIFDYIGLRLYRYVNSIVSTILYYKKRNSDVTIAELLNSICETYEYYMENIKNSSDLQRELYELTRPKYIFIE